MACHRRGRDVLWKGSQVTPIARIALSAAALGAAACLGAYLRPPRIETREVTRDVVRYQDRVEYRDRIEYRDREKVVRRVVRVLVHPDGTKEQVSTTDTGVSEKTAAQDVTVASERKQEATREHEAVTRTATQSGVTVGLMAGLRPANLGNGGDLAGQLSISKRIVGPIGAGAAVSWGPSEPLRLWGGVNWTW